MNDKDQQVVKTVHEQIAPLPSGFDANASAASVRVQAIKNPTVLERATSKDRTASQVQVYDKPMCCSTGVCGPQVDPVLPRFAADLEWLKNQGHHVERFNLAQQPDAFTKNDTVRQVLVAEGVECLPLVLVNDQIAGRGQYPSREQLAFWTGTALAQGTLPIASNSGGCCGGSQCC